MAITVNPQLPRIDQPVIDKNGMIDRAWYDFFSSVATIVNLPEEDVTAVRSVTGLNTDNADPENPVVQLTVDGTTITGSGTAVDPLVATPQGVLSGYTVATLPSGASVGDRAYVTNANAPSFLATVAGGGATRTPVFFNGLFWVCA